MLRKWTLKQILFLCAAEVADDVEDLFSGIGEHLGDGALAEVEAVVGALLDRG